MAQHRFNVFGRLVVITGARGEWTAFLLGADGERHKADFSVPGSLAEDQLSQYLADLFHEHASRTQPTVTRLDKAVASRH
jgi:hypothetical protein